MSGFGFCSSRAPYSKDLQGSTGPPPLISRTRTDCETLQSCAQCLARVLVDAVRVPAARPSGAWNQHWCECGLQAGRCHSFLGESLSMSSEISPHLCAFSRSQARVSSRPRVGRGSPSFAWTAAVRALFIRSCSGSHPDRDDRTGTAGKPTLRLHEGTGVPAPADGAQGLPASLARFPQSVQSRHAGRGQGLPYRAGRPARWRNEGPQSPPMSCWRTTACFCAIRSLECSAATCLTLSSSTSCKAGQPGSREQTATTSISMTT